MNGKVKIDRPVLSSETIKCMEQFAMQCLEYCKNTKIKLNIPRNVHNDWEGIMEKLLAKERDKISKGSTIYILFGINEEMLYIGKCNDAYTRLRSHLVKKSDKTESKLKKVIEYVKQGNYTIYFSVVSLKPIGINAFCENYLQEKCSFRWCRRKG